LHALWKSQVRDAAAEAALVARLAELAAHAGGIAPPPLVSGDDLIRLGAAPGPGFKRWLDELYDRQLEGAIATKEDAVAAAKALVLPVASEPRP
jgi:hypothetical protein